MVRISGHIAITTITKIEEMNSSTELRADAGKVSSSEVAVVLRIFSRQTGSCSLAWYSGSLSSSLPRLKLYSDIKSVPNRVAGIVTIKIESKVMLWLILASSAR
ncbi:Uncharacterised protein [Vibrio cholerae]|nr:Uncharacterised protein [Vibrio cholerae]